MISNIQKRIINHLLKQPIASFFIIPNSSSYRRVCSLWDLYLEQPEKVLSIINKNLVVQSAFEFHKESFANHVILFYSAGTDQCLLLCKINNEYLNTLIPEINLKIRGKSFIATYV